MSPESTIIFSVAAGFLFLILFGKALELLVERTRSFWGGKKTSENDLLRIEQNALNIKIDALKMKLDAFRSELHALSARVDTMPAQLPEQSSIAPTSETTWPEAEIEDNSAEQNTWARRANVDDKLSVARTTNEGASGDTWTRP